MIYEWLLEKGYSIPKVEFFSGEIWHTPFGYKVLDLTLDYLHKGMNINMFLVASNFSFILDEKATAKIHSYVQRFDDCGHPLVFSCSCDGKIIEEISRPAANGKTKPDEFWDKLFDFCKVNSFWFHPMIAANNVAYWCENYDWWMEQCKKYNLPIKRVVNMLEVRNNDWTEQSIKDYCKFIDHLMNLYLQECNNDIKLYAQRIMHLRDAGLNINENFFESGYCPINIGQVDTFPGCTVATDLTIRVGDLAICPCHRTAYNKYLYGHLTTEDGRITGLQAANVNMAIKTLFSNITMCWPGCDTCLFNETCLHGCLGSQIESTGDPFFPAESVCAFFKAKYAHILLRYEELKIIDYLRTFTPYERDYDMAQHILRVYDKWVEEGKPYVLAESK